MRTDELTHSFYHDSSNSLLEKHKDKIASVAEHLKELNASGRDCVITFHSKGDIDAVCSAYLLTMILRNAKIFYFDTIVSSARRVCDAIGIKMYDDIKLDMCRCPVIVVDTQSKDLLHGLGTMERVDTVIDHHSYAEEIIEAEHSVVIPEAYSSTQIVYYLLKEAGIKISGKIASCILLGIIDDTMRFREADSTIFENVYSLLPISCLSYADMVSLCKDESLTNKVNTVKACSTLDYSTVDNLLIITAHAPSNEGSVTTMLSNIGDVVFAGTVHKEGIRVSARSSVPDIDLRKIVRTVSKRLDINISFGGHPYALGMSVRALEDAVSDKNVLLKTVLRQCLEETKAFLKTSIHRTNDEYNGHTKR